MTKDPAELEARLLQTIVALRRIRDVLAPMGEPLGSEATGQGLRAARSAAFMCSSYAASVVAEVTS